MVDMIMVISDFLYVWLKNGSIYSNTSNNIVLVTMTAKSFYTRSIKLDIQFVNKVCQIKLDIKFDNAVYHIRLYIKFDYKSLPKAKQASNWT